MLKNLVPAVPALSVLLITNRDQLKFRRKVTVNLIIIPDLREVTKYIREDPDESPAGASRLSRSRQGQGGEGAPRKRSPNLCPVLPVTKTPQNRRGRQGAEPRRAWWPHGPWWPHCPWFLKSADLERVCFLSGHKEGTGGELLGTRNSSAGSGGGSGVSCCFHCRSSTFCWTFWGTLYFYDSPDPKDPVPAWGVCLPSTVSHEGAGAGVPRCRPAAQQRPVQLQAAVSITPPWQGDKKPFLWARADAFGNGCGVLLGLCSVRTSRSLGTGAGSSRTCSPVQCHRPKRPAAAGKRGTFVIVGILFPCWSLTRSFAFTFICFCLSFP